MEDAGHSCRRHGGAFVMLAFPARGVVAEAVPSAADGGSAAPLPYVPLHVHSDYSLLDGASRLSDLVARASELDTPALALTDHGVLYGAIELVRTCTAAGVKPIVGNEMYVVNAPLGDDAVGKKRFHLTVLAKNTTGYRSLVALTTRSHLDGWPKRGGMFSRPAINKELLAKHADGLIIASGCLSGEIPRALLANDWEEARRVAAWYRDTFPGDFYLELQDHGLPQDVVVNKGVAALAKEMDLPLIATNDSHFTSAQDAAAHDALICMRTGKKLADKARLVYTGHEYFKSTPQLLDALARTLDPDVALEALRNTVAIADKVSAYDILGETRIPDFPIPDSFAVGADDAARSHSAYLRHVTLEGLAARARRSNISEERLANEYMPRLTYELDMLERMGFPSYFLVVWDFIRFAREEGIPVGPGRGSAAGSLVAYVLNITTVDPLVHGLLFERFLNPERASMPDIDTDFSVEGREKVIQYVTRKYGEDRVAQIITFARMTSKALLKDVARVHNVKYSEADQLAKLIPVVRGKPATLEQLLSKNTPSAEFKKAYTSQTYKVWVPDEEEAGVIEGEDGEIIESHADELPAPTAAVVPKRRRVKVETSGVDGVGGVWETRKFRDLIDKAKRIEGTKKSYGVHAAGVVISSRPLAEIVPLSRGKNGETITQYAMEDVEALGLLKMDFLGLKTLSIIDDAVKLINSRRVAQGLPADVDVSVDALPMDDQPTYDLLASGKLYGVFQLDASAGMRSIVRQLRPSSLADISSILALYRPGPLDAGLIPKFIARKHGREAIEVVHPLLKPILEETYGILVYQEQIMRVARELAGYSLGEADILRRAMGKKKVDVMEREQGRFVAGCVSNGVPEGVATDLFAQMLLFAEYCFNKSHSSCYAYLTYQTAWLKANHPVEFFTALLRANVTASDKLGRYVVDADAAHVRVRPPDINRSELGFTPVYDEEDEGGGPKRYRGAILFGLEAVKTVGATSALPLIEERRRGGPFRNIADMLARLPSSVINKRSLEALVSCGAFDSLHDNRRALLDALPHMLVLRKRSTERGRRLDKRAVTAADKAAVAAGGTAPAGPEAVAAARADLMAAAKWVTDTAKEQESWDELELSISTAARDTPDFPLQTRLQMEKEMLGFYASAHPLSNLGPVTDLLRPTSLVDIVGSDETSEDGVDLDVEPGLNATTGGDAVGGGSGRHVVVRRTDAAVGSDVVDARSDDRALTPSPPPLAAVHTASVVKEGTEVVTLGLVTGLKMLKTSARKQLMATWTLEDESATLAAVAFPSTMPVVQPALADEARVLCWGKVQRDSGGYTQLIVDDVQRVRSASVLLLTRTRDTPHSGIDDLGEQAGFLVRGVTGAQPSSASDRGGGNRRTWRKKVDLDTLPRIAVVLDAGDPAGAAVGDGSRERIYLGNHCRVHESHLGLVGRAVEKMGCTATLIHLGDHFAVDAAGVRAAAPRVFGLCIDNERGTPDQHR